MQISQPAEVSFREWRDAEPLLRQYVYDLLDAERASCVAHLRKQIVDSGTVLDGAGKIFSQMPLEPEARHVLNNGLVALQAPIPVVLQRLGEAFTEAWNHLRGESSRWNETDEVYRDVVITRMYRRFSSLDVDLAEQYAIRAVMMTAVDAIHKALPAGFAEGFAQGFNATGHVGVENLRARAAAVLCALSELGMDDDE